MRILVCLLPFVLLITTSSTYGQSTSDTLHAKLLELSKQTTLPGFAVGIVNKDEILYMQGFGWADRTSKTPYTEHTIQNIGSVSKTFIGVAIMQLVEQQKLSLDTKVNTVLPFKVSHPRFPKIPITVRQLVNHTSGIRDTPNYNKKCYVLLDDPPADLSGLSKSDQKYFKPLRKNVEQPLSDFLKSYLVKGGKLFKKKNFNEHQPETVCEYTNIGSALAALVVEEVSGMSYDAYVYKHIMQPLEMTASGWRFEDIDKSKHATLYSGNDATIPAYTLITYPDGGVLSSCQDLCHYLKAMMQGYAHEGEFLSPTSFDELFTPTVKDGKESIGVFWTTDKHCKIGHAGGDPGIFTYIQMDPKWEFGVVFMTNCLIDQRRDQFIDFVKVWKTLWRYGIDL